MCKTTVFRSDGRSVGRLDGRSVGRSVGRSLINEFEIRPFTLQVMSSTVGQRVQL